MSDALNEGIKKFYNNSTPLWLRTWGEHMHHGFYGFDGKEIKDDKQAQIDLINELLHWGNIKNVSSVLDAGCGVGGSARYLSEKFNAQVTGVTLSDVQAEKAKQLNKNAGVENNISIVVQDMMTLNKKNGQYDLIWSLESAEHIENKNQLLDIFHEVLNPGGKFMMATWCSRNTPPPLYEREQRLLNNIYKLYYLPQMISENEYKIIAEQNGFTNIKTSDWTKAVEPFWSAVIRSALKVKNIKGLFMSGLPTIKGAWAMRYMRKGFKDGTIKFIVIQGEKL